MQTRGQSIIRPPLQCFANVDHHIASSLTTHRHEGIRAWTSTLLDLEATDVILEEESDDTEIEVWPDSAYLALFDVSSGDRRVMEEAEFAGIAGAISDEETLGQSKSEFEG